MHLKQDTMNLTDTKKTIELLENINSSDDYAYERAVLAYLKLGGLPVFTNDLSSGLSFFHTRTHESEDFFFKISDISIPPQKFVKDFARCNRPFQSVFYCSETRPTSYMELLENWVDSKKIGEILKITLGLWELKKSIKTIIVTTPDPENRISSFDKEHGTAFDSLIMKNSGEELEAQKLFYRFLFEKFRKPAKKDLKTYIITSSYCNVALMHTNGQADGIYFPSVPFKENGINLCINRDFFNAENIELKTEIRYEFSITENEQKKHYFREIGKIESREIRLQEDLLIWNK
jgi:hypothetical protein